MISLNSTPGPKSSFARILAWAGVLLSVLLYWQAAGTSRSDFGAHLSLLVALFLIYAAGFKGCKVLNTWVLLRWIVLLRLPFFLELPQLSDDFYRFLWDGLLLTKGINPFGAVPAEMDLGIFADQAFAEKLLSGMNSAEYGSVYPPLHQAVFWIGAQLSGGSLLAGVNAMRAVILLAEAGMAVYFLRFSQWKNAGFVTAAYLLNPLVVVEGTGNVHMEALMLPFLAVG